MFNYEAIRRKALFTRRKNAARQSESTRVRRNVAEQRDTAGSIKIISN
jgi:hypothetical protein